MEGEGNMEEKRVEAERRKGYQKRLQNGKAPKEKKKTQRCIERES